MSHAVAWESVLTEIPSSAEMGTKPGPAKQYQYSGVTGSQKLLKLTKHGTICTDDCSCEANNEQDNYPSRQPLLNSLSREEDSHHLSSRVANSAGHSANPMAAVQAKCARTFPFRASGAQLVSPGVLVASPTDRSSTLWVTAKQSQRSISRLQITTTRTRPRHRLHLTTFQYSERHVG